VRKGGRGWGVGGGEVEGKGKEENKEGGVIRGKRKRREGGAMRGRRGWEV